MVDKIIDFARQEDADLSTVPRELLEQALTKAVSITVSAQLSHENLLAYHEALDRAKVAEERSAWALEQYNKKHSDAEEQLYDKLQAMNNDMSEMNRELAELRMYIQELEQRIAYLEGEEVDDF